MKLQVISDLHLEFAEAPTIKNVGSDVLILGGDICLAEHLYRNPTAGLDDKIQNGFYANDAIRYRNFFKYCSENWKTVIYLAGNHEHYHGDFKYTVPHLKSMLKYLPNLQILDKETWTLYDDVVFVGGTLWTDMNKEDPLTLMHIRHRMNDFRCVDNSNRMVTRKVPLYEENLLWTEDGKNGGKYTIDEKGFYKQIGTKKKQDPSTFSPEDAYDEHVRMVGYIQSVIEGRPNEKFVVVGHHAPSKQSTHPRYARETLMNGGYSSDLSEFILDHPEIKLWTHGHTHEDFDYMIGSTRIVCNPRGYINYEERADNFQLKVVEV